MLRTKAIRIACLLTAASALALPATAATDTDNLSVTATVVATCNITGATLAFGNYNGTVDDNQADITVQCTNTTAYTVILGVGLAAGATTSTRQMDNGSGVMLNYALFSDAGRTANWGILGADDVADTGDGSAKTHTVYGRIAAGQFVAPGAFTDTVVATVTY